MSDSCETKLASALAENIQLRLINNDLRNQIIGDKLLYTSIACSAVSVGIYLYNYYKIYRHY